MRVGVARQFVAELGCGIGRNGAQLDVTLGEGCDTGGSINRTGGGKNEFLHVKFTAKLENVGRASDVDLFIFERSLDGWANARKSR